MLRALIVCTLLAMGLAGCAGEKVWAPQQAVDAVRYRDPGPAKLTLFTMVSNSNGSGGHSSLMINGSQRVIFDPAGSFKHPAIPERNDVVYGITPQIEDVYVRYHARQTWHVVIQEVTVPDAVAEQALREAMAYGAVPSAQCALSTSTILSHLPGFQSIGTTWSPIKLEGMFRKIPGVTESVLHEYDGDDKSVALRNWDPSEYLARKQARTQ